MLPAMACFAMNLCGRKIARLVYMHIIWRCRRKHALKLFPTDHSKSLMSEAQAVRGNKGQGSGNCLFVFISQTSSWRALTCKTNLLLEKPLSDSQMYAFGPPHLLASSSWSYSRCSSTRASCVVSISIRFEVEDHVIQNTSGKSQPTSSGCKQRISTTIFRWCLTPTYPFWPRCCSPVDVPIDGLKNLKRKSVRTSAMQSNVVVTV